MKLLPIFLFLLAAQLTNCKKSGSGPAAQVSYISAGNVSQTRDSVNTTLKFPVTVEPASANTITVNYTTAEGTALANTDFVPASGTLTIPPNTTQATVEVQIKGRKLSQGTQEFYLQLSNAANAVIKFEKGTATLQNTGVGYSLVWSDEFNGTALNTADWNYETGAGGWGNNELENYTSGTNNAYLQGGNLVIEAKKENLGSSNYTSARLTTSGKRKFTYGKVEIRAKLPIAKGIWPALWMLGQNISTVPWPACGEIDIMETIGETAPSKSYGTAHWGLSTAAHLQGGGSYALPSGTFADDFHLFTIDWTADKIQWFVDGVKFYEITKAQITGGNYPFDKDFFLIMNVAVGGNWPGNPDASTIFPQKMYVDYIRVYQK